MKIRIFEDLDKIVCWDDDIDQFVIYTIVERNDDSYIIDEYCDYYENCNVSRYLLANSVVSEYDLPYHCETKSNNEVTSVFYEAAFDFLENNYNKQLWIDY